VTERARDPRSIRTAAALQDALRDLVRDRPLDSISVSELCRVADVRRTTYYTHFESIPHQLTELLVDELEEALAPGGPRGSIAETADAMQDGLVAALEVVRRDCDLYRSGLDTARSGSLRRALVRMLGGRLDAAIDTWNELGLHVDVDRRIAVPFAAGGLTLTIEAWALSDETDAVEWAEGMRQEMPSWWPRAEDCPGNERGQRH
jgi:AcrR family transcriptional regulator